jgi:hypothetical protein
VRCTVDFTGPAANEQCRREASWWVRIGTATRVPRCGPHSRNSAREPIRRQDTIFCPVRQATGDVEGCTPEQCAAPEQLPVCAMERRS